MAAQANLWEPEIALGACSTVMAYKKTIWGSCEDTLPAFLTNWFGSFTKKWLTSMRNRRFFQSKVTVQLLKHWRIRRENYSVRNWNIKKTTTSLFNSKLALATIYLLIRRS